MAQNGWPEVLQFIQQSLASENPSEQEVSIISLHIVCYIKMKKKS